MLYMDVSEIPLLSPQVVDETALEGAGAFNYISAASNAIDAYCGAPLYYRTVTNEQITLDSTLTGKLMNRPFRGWVGTTGTLYKFGSNISLGNITLSDFSVMTSSGVLQNMNASPISNTGGGGGGGGGGESCWVGGGGGGGGNTGSISRNSHPYFMVASYTAGYFSEKAVGPSGLINGATTVIVGDISGLTIGGEFYFNTDPVNEQVIDKRYITALDPLLSKVTFSPALGYSNVTAVKLRSIDRQVRSACGDIVADMVVYPANTSMFWDELGKGNLISRWKRLTNMPISEVAAMKLRAYCQ